MDIDGAILLYTLQKKTASEWKVENAKAAHLPTAAATSDSIFNKNSGHRGQLTGSAQMLEQDRLKTGSQLDWTLRAGPGFCYGLHAATVGRRPSQHCSKDCRGASGGACPLASPALTCHEAPLYTNGLTVTAPQPCTKAGSQYDPAVLMSLWPTPDG